MPDSELPVGGAPEPVAAPHFPTRAHAFVWRNWPLVPVARLAQVAGTTVDAIARMGRAMGLGDPPTISSDRVRRSAITVIRRNWHLLPYPQLLELLDWTAEELAYALREDDFLYIKLGSLKPACEPLRDEPPNAETQRREAEIAALVHDQFPQGIGAGNDPLFAFVEQLSAPQVRRANTEHPTPNALSPRFCYSYFGLYGDPLLEEVADPYPDGYLARLAEAGVDGVWLQGVLYRLAPFPWQPELSARYEERLESLRRLVKRARAHGIGVYLYLNEPRTMPLAFFDTFPDLKGVVAGDHAALCTSSPEVRAYLTESVATICRAAPDLAGFFTITASENPTNCWSHHRGHDCPRCGPRGPAIVIAEVNACVREGIERAGSNAALIAYDWGWREENAPAIIERLPDGVSVMCVSEWSLPVTFGDVTTTVGEYSLSLIGPGPRALRHWKLAQQRGLKTVAKIQASNTWELSAVPYLPVIENIARHVANLSAAGVDGLMLGWTLGGYPSPNLEVVAELGQSGTERPPDPEAAMLAVASRRFGTDVAPSVVQFWRECSAAFREFPYHGGVLYQAPLQMGPANPLWEQPTGYRSTMVGLPYDDLDGWRAVYPPDLFIAQMEKVADGFDAAIARLCRCLPSPEHLNTRPPEHLTQHLIDELRVGEAAAIHFRSVAQQSRFVLARKALEAAATAAEATLLIDTLERLLAAEMNLARRLHDLQVDDSRIGFEASNQYYYVPVDLAEKVLNCRDLLTRRLPEQRARWAAVR